VISLFSKGLVNGQTIILIQTRDGCLHVDVDFRRPALFVSLYNDNKNREVQNFVVNNLTYLSQQNMGLTTDLR
jgi:hypothetical protein